MHQLGGTSSYISLGEVRRKIVFIKNNRNSIRISDYNSVHYYFLKVSTGNENSMNIARKIDIVNLNICIIKNG